VRAYKLYLLTYLLIGLFVNDTNQCDLIIVVAVDVRYKLQVLLLPVKMLTNSADFLTYNVTTYCDGANNGPFLTFDFFAVFLAMARNFTRQFNQRENRWVALLQLQ